MASPCGAVTLAAVHAETGLQAAVAVETVRAGLVTVKPRPTRLARTLTLHWVTAAQTETNKDEFSGRFVGFFFINVQKSSTCPSIKVLHRQNFIFLNIRKEN